MNHEQEATGSGIVVLSSSLQVLHLNRRAMNLLTQLERTAQSIGMEETVTGPLHRHCQDVIETLPARMESNNWEPFHQYRTIGDVTHAILLKGFGLLDRRGLLHSRIVMLLYPYPKADVGNRQTGILGQTPRRSSSLRWRLAACNRYVSYMLPSSSVTRSRA